LIVDAVLGGPFRANAHDCPLSAMLAGGIPYEPSTVNLLRENIKPGMTTVDIGANIGYITTLLAGLVGPEGRVYSFEPEPNNYAILWDNIVTRKLARVFPVNAGLYDSAGDMTMHLSPHNLGMHSMTYWEDGWPAIRVPVVTYDEFFGPDRSIDFVKLDVEGSEAAVLAGASYLMGPQGPSMLLMELNVNMQQRAARPMDAVLHDLIHAGFKLSIIRDNGLESFSGRGVDRVIDEFTKTYGNMWCER